MISFVKMHANGNDFMIIDAWQHTIAVPEASLIMQWADRHTGIGFDQLLYFTPSNQPNAAVHCRVFNADGSESGQCGHGMACIAQLVYQQGYLENTCFNLATTAGLWEATIIDAQTVIVDLGHPIFAPQSIPFVVDNSSLLYPLVCEDVDESQHNMLQDLQSVQTPLLNSFLDHDNRLDHNHPYMLASVLSLGNPHCVVPVAQLDTLPVPLLGQILSEHSQFPEQANVECMEIVQPDIIRLRVYERGVGENRACGSGACAAVIAGHLLGYLAEEVTVQFPQGDTVQVIWPNTTDSVKLKTTVRFVFKGQL